MANENVYCSWCNALLNEQEDFENNDGTWVCRECGHLAWGKLKFEGKRFEDVIWMCDNCDDILNNQDGFTDEVDEWKCKKCGHINPISMDEIYEEEKVDGPSRVSMNVNEAQKMLDKLVHKKYLTDEEKFLLIETLDFLIETCHEPADMMYLGGIYYEQKHFNLAFKYYEMAATYDYVDAYNCLGYIWYYGRTGEKDYKKAFENFSKAAEKGVLQSAYKLADMYKNGYYVEKNPEKYKEIIEELAVKIEDAQMLNDPLPEIYTRLAKIRTEEGEIEEAVGLYYMAKDFLAQRIRYNAYFGNLNIMKWLIDDLYELIEFDKDDFDFFDLYYLLKTPHKVHFKYKKKTLTAESLMEDGECVINFEGQWYRTPEDFVSNSNIDGTPLTALNQELYVFECEE